jgi:hypothetical protein
VRVGRGLPALMVLGRVSSTTAIEAGGGVGLVRDSGGVEARFLRTDSTRAARAGNFLFLSICGGSCSHAGDEGWLRRVADGVVRRKVATSGR